MPEPTLTGGCLCGGVRFELTEPPGAASYCHCTRCQRRTGTAASANASIDGRTLRLLQGEELVKGWRHPEGASRSSSAANAARICSAAIPTTRPRWACASERSTAIRGCGRAGTSSSLTRRPGSGSPTMG